MPAKSDKPASTQEVMKFFDWALKNGQKMAEELDYVPLPESVVKLITDEWRAQVKDAGGKALWN
jgi:phosphate transport system substrate-binding protein